MVKMLLVYVSSVRNWGMSTFWAQKIALKKSIEFTRFINYILLFILLLKSHRICKFHRFFNCSFLRVKCAHSSKKWHQLVILFTQKLMLLTN